uniref:vomeronasal type-1 receptor 45-like n=1 Tax=Urocitellus parryii TaxID=9999 RepID=UPI000E55A04D|nr:vomeronasal type-1 receptor 45-like [Urocitellus parryii]
MGHKPRLTDLPITYLALTHILMLLTMVLLVSTDIWETQDIPGDFKCKVLVFLNKVMRRLSICTAYVLSVLQAITISPSGSQILLIYTVATPNKIQPGLLYITEHCSFLPMSYFHRPFFLTFMACRDVFFVGLMVLFIEYMVILIYRQTQWSQHLHNSRFSPKSSPEQRATHTILLLICCFAILYCADSIISMAIGLTCTRDAILVCFQMLVSNGYGTLSADQG